MYILQCKNAQIITEIYMTRQKILHVHMSINVDPFLEFHFYTTMIWGNIVKISLSVQKFSSFMYFGKKSKNWLSYSDTIMT